MLDKVTNRNNVLEKALDATWLRDEAISQNLANIDTPGYKRKTVAFEECLNQALDDSSFKGFKSDKLHIDIGGSSVDDVDIKTGEDNKSLSMRIDGNNVDAESENASKAKNAIQYNTLIQAMNQSFRRMKSVISEGRR